MKKKITSSRLAIEQITSVDRYTEVVEYDCEEIPESLDKTWIISGQSPAQREIIKTLPRTEVLYVEGAFRVWLKDAQVRKNYFKKSIKTYSKNAIFRSTTSFYAVSPCRGLPRPRATRTTWPTSRTGR